MCVGWIKIHRKITESSLWLQESFTKSQAWVDLLLIANYEPSILMVRGVVGELKRGDGGGSMNNLSLRWKWSKSKVKYFLKFLV